MNVLDATDSTQAHQTRIRTYATSSFSGLPAHEVHHVRRDVPGLRAGRANELKGRSRFDLGIMADNFLLQRKITECKNLTLQRPGAKFLPIRSLCRVF